MAYQNPYYTGGYFPQQQNYYPQTGAMMDTLNQFKGQYQQPMQMPNQPMQQAPTQQTASNDIIWVQGEAGAKAYLVAPNNTVTLWDSENPVIYIKSADASGIPSLRTLDWTERTPEQKGTPVKHECQCGGKYAKIDDFKALEAKYEALEATVASLVTKTKAKSKVKEDSNDD